MANKIQITANFSDGQTLKQFADLLQQRMKYMHETARDSIAACAINALKSIRAVTKVAKPSKVKVDLKKMLLSIAPAPLKAARSSRA